MGKRIAIALALWFALMIIWTEVFMKKDPKETAATGKGQTNVVAGSKTNATQPKTTEKKELAGGPLVKERPRTETEKDRVALVETDTFQVGLNRVEGTVDALRIRKYKENGKPIDFIEKNVEGYGNFRVSFSSLEKASGEKETTYEHRKVSELEHAFTARTEAGLLVTKTYKFYTNQNYFDVSVKLRNASGKAWKRDGDVAYSLLWGSPINWRTDKNETSFYDKYQVSYFTDEGSLEEATPERPMTSFKWVAVEDRYFMLAVIPVEENGAPRAERRIRTGNMMDSAAKTHKRFSLNREVLTLPEQGESVDHYRVFFGPKMWPLLTSAPLSPYKLQEAYTGFVLIKWLAIGFEQLIYLLQSVVSNYGIVIILITILIKLLFHPLTHKSYESMRKMQLIQPKMKAIQEQFKGDPKTLQKHMMELYRKEGVSPMGGCLPLLLQIPVFIALIQVLPYMIELKNVSFLWIKDLSSPDTIAKVNLGLTDSLNLMPILMTAVSLLQVKLQNYGSGMQISEQQKRTNQMMIWMQVFFLVLLWNVPSGLVLYWTVQNMIQILQQLYINKRLAAPAATK